MVIPHYHFPSGSYNNHVQEKKERKKEKGKKEENPKSIPKSKSKSKSKSESKSVIVPRSVSKDIPTLTPALPSNNQRNRATRPLNSALETPP